MTEAALAGRPTTMYPGGPAERDQSIRVARKDTAASLVARFDHASTALNDRWRVLEPRDWTKRLLEDRLGEMQLGRLVALRLTELEVHHSDLALGYAIQDWAAEFARVCLPLRFAWLGAHHRNRAAADRTVNGTWLFVCRPGPRCWLVSADGPAAFVRAASPDEPCDVALTGSSTDVLAFLLGRRPVAELDVAGDRGLAGRFKFAFPGP